MRRKRDDAPSLERRKPYNVEAYLNSLEEQGAMKPTRVGPYGEISIGRANQKNEVLGENDNGEKLHRENGRTYLNLHSEKGEQQKVEVRLSKIGPVVNDYINFLSNQGNISLPIQKTDSFVFYEGSFPDSEPDGGLLEYSGKAKEIMMYPANGSGERPEVKKIVLVNSRLSNAQKIATVYRALVHARGIVDEKKTQLETIAGLREIMHSYPWLINHKQVWEEYFSAGNAPDTLEEGGDAPREMRGALKYAIHSKGSFEVSYKDIKTHLRAKKRGLEKVARAILLALFPFVFVLLLSFSSITGFAVREVSGQIVGISELFILVYSIGLIIYLAHHFEQEREINDLFLES